MKNIKALLACGMAFMAIACNEEENTVSQSIELPQQKVTAHTKAIEEQMAERTEAFNTQHIQDNPQKLNEFISRQRQEIIDLNNRQHQ